MNNYIKYFERESYLFEDVHSHFHAEHSLGAFDFFSIVIWKANRAKSKIARRLLHKDLKEKSDLDTRCRVLTASLYKAPEPKERLRLLIEDWGFSLPMASVILAVCWPEEFAVYDYRVRDQIEGFRKLNSRNFEKLWGGYQEYKARISKLVPRGFSLRDKDRYLYGRSNAVQLENDIQRSFGVLDNQS